MGTKVDDDDDLEQAVDCASQRLTMIQNMQKNPDFAGRPSPYEHHGDPAPASKPVQNVDYAKVEHRGNSVLDYEPMRTLNFCYIAAPPRRFYRTFWRGLADRLKKLESIKRRQSVESAIKSVNPNQTLAEPCK